MLSAADKKMLRQAARRFVEWADGLFGSEVDRSGPWKGQVTHEPTRREIEEYRATAKALRALAARRAKK